MGIRGVVFFLLSAAITPPAVAGFSHGEQMKLCHNVRSLVRAEWQHHLYAASPAVSDVMVAAMDGDTPAVRKGLAALPKDRLARWRQTALSQAALGGHTATVRALIADGADPKVRTWIPPHTERFYRHMLSTMKRDPHFGGLVTSMRKAGVIQNRGEWEAPPLFHAAECDQAEMVGVLLEAGVPVSATWRRHGRGADALMVAVLNGNARTVRVLLGHGALPCRDDRLMARRARQIHRSPAPTLAGIGRKSGLPSALLAHLECRARQERIRRP